MGWVARIKIRESIILADVLAREHLPYKPNYDLVFLEQGSWKCSRCGSIIASDYNPPEMCFKDQGGCGTDCDFIRFKNVTPLEIPINGELWRYPIYKEIKDLNMLDVYNEIFDISKKIKTFEN